MKRKENTVNCFLPNFVSIVCNFPLLLTLYIYPHIEGFGLQFKVGRY